MFRRVLIVLLLGSLVLVGAACKNKNVKNPLASVDSKQPDKVLFDRAMQAMQSRKYDVARLTLQTLINTYPDSEYVARAKLAIGDSWMAEGGSTALAQAENEYKDFITFFPNMPEAAEAQMKVADIHYRQIEKADRDYTHAKRAEDEYRQVLLQYPDNKQIADQARIRLLEVQEILADREFRIGRFYYMRGSWAAAIARLKTVTDTYPLYSQSDEALFLLGQAYEHELAIVRAAQIKEVAKAKLVKMYTDGAEAAYDKIITRYPVTERVPDAKARLEAMDLPVPKPTQEAIDLNKKEEASRTQSGKMGKVMSNFHKHPDFGPATKVGEPTLVDPKETNATAIIKEANDIVREASTAPGGNVTVETVSKDGKIPESQPIPRSDSGSADTGAGTPAGQGNGGGTTAEPPKPAPEQVNEAAAPSTSNPGPQATADKSSTSNAQQTTDDKSQSSSKKKKKKKLLIF